MLRSILASLTSAARSSMHLVSSFDEAATWLRSLPNQNPALVAQTDLAAQLAAFAAP